MAPRYFSQFDKTRPPRRAIPRRHRDSQVRSCIVVADTSRARIYAHQWPAVGAGSSDWRPLRQVRSLVSLAHTLRSPGPLPRADLDRDRYRQQQRFAYEVARAIGVVCQLMERCRLILWASSDLVDDVRDALAVHPEWTGGIDEYVEGYRALKRLDVPELHKWLAGEGLAESR